MNNNLETPILRITPVITPNPFDRAKKIPKKSKNLLVPPSSSNTTSSLNHNRKKKYSYTI